MYESGLKQENQKEKSLESLAQKLILLFIKDKIINLDKAADKLYYSNQKSLLKTKIRRLYDIMNVFKSLGLITKTSLNFRSAYKWQGINGVRNYIQSHYIKKLRSDSCTLTNQLNLFPIKQEDLKVEEESIQPFSKFLHLNNMQFPFPSFFNLNYMAPSLNLFSKQTVIQEQSKHVIDMTNTPPTLNQNNNIILSQQNYYQLK